ncbi:DNA-J related domain-containing protein [Thiomicrospira microaerophila]|uniref:DNA-J related domain-containing protein n=1 Tax=Thiomicrospira microaerophila TaxID=406020 RepID=UPI0012FD539B|nr:DNA-J related domain-containing protein [Thiomicrospira microaerophila]
MNKYNTQPAIPQALEATLLELIQTSPKGISEHLLLKQLAERGYPEFAPSLEPLKLFQAHFLLFHLLYRLQAPWRQQGLGDLDIHCLSIRFKPAPPLSHDCALAVNDSLRDYYLDYHHYRETQSADVVKLLDDFWQTFAGVKPTHHPDIDQARKTLDIAPDQPLNKAIIDQAYRRLCQVHHPDKGGHTAEFQKISQAAATLRQCLC